MGPLFLDGTAVLANDQFRRTEVPANVPVAALDAAVPFAVWLYTAEAQTLLRGHGLPPIVADASRQNAYWAKQAGGLSDVGDWRRFADPQQGWPAVDASPLGDALMAAATAPGTLAAQPSQAEATMNRPALALAAGRRTAG